MNKTRIEWADYSWNPIKGLCPEACWYCYARSIYQRFDKYIFGKDHAGGDIWLDRHELISPISKDSRSFRHRPDGSLIFVCSTFELFNPIADSWRDDIFQIIEESKRDTFIILTKRPERIDRPMPDNVWLGVSVDGEKDDWRIKELKKHQAAVRFVSLEPFLGLFPKEDIGWLDWFIIGRLTGHGYRRNPARATLAEIRAKVQGLGIPLFEKNNLEGIWGDPLIQEYPE